MNSSLLGSSPQAATEECVSRFLTAVDDQVAKFTEARLLQRLERSDVQMRHYHLLLTTLFHQTRSSPYTFARAAVNCSWHHAAAKEYLLKHAEEERTHWQWILDDLKATGYLGPDPRNTMPHPTCQAYVGLNYFVSEEFPVARLAIAAVLEGIGSQHGGNYGRKLLQVLGLKASQASFFLNHGETDKTHALELRNMITLCDLTTGEWFSMDNTARTAGLFYRQMYDHEGYS